MALEIWANSSNTHHEDRTFTTSSPNHRVAEILDSAESVFEVAIIKNPTGYGSIFYIPKEAMNNPVADIFIPANLWLRKFNTGDFIPANIGWDNNPHICRARHHIWNNGHTSYLLRKI